MTDREKEIAQALCQRDAKGRYPTMADVAKHFGIKVSTAKAHLRSIALKVPNPHGLPAQRLVRATLVHGKRGR